MTITGLRTTLTRRSAFSGQRQMGHGGMFYRWYVRRERINELKRLLSLKATILSDLGLSQKDIEAEIERLTRNPA